MTAGKLIVFNRTGSATGSGSVHVDGGTLGGQGIVAGAVTIGTGSGSGATLAPGTAAKKTVRFTTLNSITFKSDGSYTYKLNTARSNAGQLIAYGVMIESGAQFSFNPVGNKKLTIGKVFTAISNTFASPISGTFANLADGSTFIAGQNNFQVSYSGGDGNDLTLTVVP